MCRRNRPETACNDGEDNDCDRFTDCLDSDCAGAANCPTYPAFGVCKTYRPCGVECGYLGGPTGIYTDCTNIPYTKENICYYGTVGCCSCTEDPTCSLCDSGHGFCSWSGKDEYKEPTCTTPICLNKVLKTNTANENYCTATGWQCKYTETAVQCCGDPDCAGLTCAAEGYGARVKTCKPDDPGKYTCVCGACLSNSDCVNQCCEKSPEINSDVNGDGRIEDCVPLGSVALSNKYLCASASPTGWHECDAANFAKTIKNADASYVCLEDNGQYEWNDVSWLKNVMIAIAFAFVLMFLVRKRF